MAKLEPCFCAFCRKERRVYSQKNIDFTDFLVTGVASISLTFVIWQELNPKGFLLWIPIVLLTAVSIHLRWRLTLPCPHCGFDPVLYTRDRHLAAERVKRFLQRRRLDPSYLLAEPLDLPKIVKKPVRTLLASSKKVDLPQVSDSN